MRSWIPLSALLAAAGIGLFLYKVFVLDYPLRPGAEMGAWRVQLSIDVTGDQGRAVVEAPLPRTSTYQRLLTEEVRSGPLRFSINEDTTGRHARWAGRLDGTTSLSYEVTAAIVAAPRRLPEHELNPDYPKGVLPFLDESPTVQTTDPLVLGLSRELRLEPGDKVPLAQAIYEFVSREVGSARAVGQMDAVTVAREGVGNPLGRARLFCALARANGLPCRVVTGLSLADRRQGAMHYWNEVHLADAWVPFDAAERRVATLPADRLIMATSDDDAVRATGTTALSYRFHVQPELDTHADLMRRRLAASPHLLDQLSPLMLPVAVQHTLRVLLLVPLGALAMCIVRNVIGIRTFGMFMPMLIALAMTATGLLWGTAFLLFIVAAALLSRLWIQRLYLLLAARVAFVLTLVILLMVGLMLAGNRLGIPTASGVGAFPFVIMTMIVERISVTLEEEGLANTLHRAAATLVAVYFTYAVIQARALQTILLVYPECLLVILALLLGIGRYTGYRLTELVRFRDVMTEPR